MSYPRKMQEKPFHYVVQKRHEGSPMSLLSVILLNFLKSKMGLPHGNVCDVCEGKEISFLSLLFVKTAITNLSECKV